MKYFSLLLLFIIFSSCSSDSDKNSSIKERKNYSDLEMIEDNVWVHKNTKELFSGIAYFLNDDQSIHYDINYVNGKANGDYIAYYDSTKFDNTKGLIRYEATYVNSLLEGEFKAFRRHGLLYSNLLYKNGLPNGKTIYFRKNEQIMEESNYVNDKKRGGSWDWRKRYGEGYYKSPSAKYYFWDWDGMDSVNLSIDMSKSCTFDLWFENKIINYSNRRINALEDFSKKDQKGLKEFYNKTINYFEKQDSYVTNVKQWKKQDKKQKSIDKKHKKWLKKNPEKAKEKRLAKEKEAAKRAEREELKQSLIYDESGNKRKCV